MLRAYLLLVSLFVCINLIGCSKEPNDKDALILAFEPPEKAAVRALNVSRAKFKTEFDKINNKVPYTSEDGNVRYNKAEFDNNAAVYYITLLNTKAIDCTNRLITDKLKPLIDSLCTDSESSKVMSYDISYEIDSYDGNGKLTTKYITNRDICNNRLYCQ